MTIKQQWFSAVKRSGAALGLVGAATAVWLSLEGTAEAQSRFGDESRYKELMKDYPLGRAAKPREIADLMVFLASDRSAYTSGAVFTVDGGLSARQA